MGCVERGDSKITPPARSTELKLIEKLASECPDIRENMVLQLKSQVLRGIYTIDPESVAGKIIQHSIIILAHSNLL
jgi:anti-sigma28 factor (negative regulator of flagellin synthesis)